MRAEPEQDERRARGTGTVDDRIDALADSELVRPLVNAGMGTIALRQEAILLDELGRYEPELLERPRLVIGTKADVATPSLDGRGFDGLTVSSVTREGLDVFLGRLAELVESARATEATAEPYVVLRPEERGFSVVREQAHEWRVTGRQAERAVALADLTNEEAIAYVQGRLRRMGVERALVRAGVADGDVVRIGDFELTYEAGL